MRLLLALFFLAIPVWSCTAQSIGDPPNARGTRDTRLAVTLVRAVNTAEIRHKQKASRFVGLEELETTKEWKESVQKLSRQESKLAEVKLSEGTKDGIPGWKLRLLVSPDGEAYLLSLQADSGEGCAEGFASDESG
jgi:hypothetical protein